MVWCRHRYVMSTAMAATIAFTLPISCQICLGRVKEPVVCSNQHVFCKTCIELWLEKNHQCPTCRISISPDNPCKPVLGGLNPEAGPERGENFSNRELRRARMELIYKDYENEIGRLEAEAEFERHKADELAKRVRGRVAEATVSTEPRSTWDYNATLILRNKIRDLTSLNDSLKTEMEKIRKELAENKEENSLLLRENQRMRLDLANRSPRRFGRFTVAALENKLAASEKEVQQLKKALENSDLYIEELEKQLEMRCSDANTENNSEKAGKNGKLVSEILNNSEQSANISAISSSDIPMEMVNVGTTPADEIPSFLLELPSTDTTLSEQSILEMNDSNGDAELIKRCHKPERSMPSAAIPMTLEFPSPSILGVTLDSSRWQTDKESVGKSASASTSFAGRDELLSISKEQTFDSCTKRLRFAQPDNHFVNPVRKSLFGVPNPTALQSEGIGYTTGVNPSSTSKFYGTRMTEPSSQNGHGLDIQNSSVTPEVEDCLRLMDAIERKVKERTSESNSLHHSSNGLFTQSASNSQQLPLSHASSSVGETNGMMTSHNLHPERQFLF